MLHNPDPDKIDAVSVFPGSEHDTSVLGEPLSDLMNREFEPIKWIVPEVLPEGLTLLAGSSKIGKSWLALQLCLAVSGGGEFLGKEIEKGDVLYWALEDGARRVQDRVRALEPETDFKEHTMTVRSMEHLPPTLDKGALDQLKLWHGSAPTPRLIVIDVLAKVKPETKGKETDYDAVYRGLAGLHRFATENSISVLVIHHTRKAAADGDQFDQVAGTRALTALPDAALVLARSSDGGGDAKIYGRGRDLVEFELPLLRTDCGGWEEVSSHDKSHLTESKQQVINALEESGDVLSSPEIGEKTGLGSYAYKLCQRMAKDGEIERVGRGKYKALAPTEELV